LSTFTRDILASAASSTRGLTTGTVANPKRKSWLEIHEHAKRIAAGLAAFGAGGHDSVAVLASDAADVAPLAQAVWLRGAVLTMLQSPTPRADLAAWLDGTVKAIQLVDANVVVVGDPFLTVRDQLAVCGRPVCTVDSLLTDQPSGLGSGCHIRETHIALRQLTSGSTGLPKAVEISHGNLAANAVALRDGLRLEIDADVMVSWLPLAHDMGMIAFLCLPMQLGVDTVIVTPGQFLRHPMTWVELISKHRGTITSGPNFAYSILARHLLRADPAEIDLSSLRVAVNGAEPINHRDVADFAAAAAPFGLRPSALMPGYGLAEATLTAALAAADEPALIETVSRRAVTYAHRAEVISSYSPDAQHVACVGHPVTGMEVRIVRERNTLRIREIGAIELRGPAIANSYLTVDGIVPLSGDDGWFDTGDLGYLDEQGRLYVCGRTKDLIVFAGKNLYPDDIEGAAEDVGGVRKGCVIALRVDGEREGFAVLAEVRTEDDDAREQISRDIAARVLRQVGHAPREVRLFPPGTLPKTASGKLRRSDARELLGASTAHECPESIILAQ
jgi:fatty-acyl-CoA synthase